MCIVLPKLVCKMFSQDELDDTAQIWNAHTIKPSKNVNVPSGRPNVMYALPELYRTTDLLAPVENENLQLCKNECIFRLTIPCDPDVYELCNMIMAESPESSQRPVSSCELIHAFKRCYQHIPISTALSFKICEMKQ